MVVRETAGDGDGRDPVLLLQKNLGAKGEADEAPRIPPDPASQAILRQVLGKRGCPVLCSLSQVLVLRCRRKPRFSNNAVSVLGALLFLEVLALKRFLQGILQKAGCLCARLAALIMFKQGSVSLLLSPGLCLESTKALTAAELLYRAAVSAYVAAACCWKPGAAAGGGPWWWVVALQLLWHAQTCAVRGMFLPCL